MTSIRDQRSEENYQLISEWIKQNPGRWFRITDIERALGLKVPVITQILKRMRSTNMIERNDDNRKPVNGKKYPVYIFRMFEVSEDGPSWFSPKPPMFASRQVVSIRFIKEGKNKSNA
jgi:Mn-dependent DtxR family transcriptional regulator